METSLPPLACEELVAGTVRILPPVSLSEAEIIEFARQFDPQYVHIDPEYAKTTRFGRIIASGLHPYIALHTRYWVDMNRAHFICGLSFDGARFFSPVFPDRPFYGKLTITAADAKPEKNSVAVHWLLEVLDAENDQLLQTDAFCTYHQYRLEHSDKK